MSSNVPQAVSGGTPKRKRDDDSDSLSLGDKISKSPPGPSGTPQREDLKDPLSTDPSQSFFRSKPISFSNFKAPKIMGATTQPFDLAGAREKPRGPYLRVTKEEVDYSSLEESGSHNSFRKKKVGVDDGGLGRYAEIPKSKYLQPVTNMEAVRGLKPRKQLQGNEVVTLEAFKDKFTSNLKFLATIPWEEPRDNPWEEPSDTQAVEFVIKSKNKDGNPFLFKFSQSSQKWNFGEFIEVDKVPAAIPGTPLQIIYNMEEGGGGSDAIPGPSTSTSPPVTVKFKEEDILGQGSFGLVYRMKDYVAKVTTSIPLKNRERYADYLAKLGGSKPAVTFTAPKVASMLDESLISLKMDSPYVTKTQKVFMQITGRRDSILSVSIQDRAYMNLDQYLSLKDLKGKERDVQLMVFEMDTLRGLDYMHKLGFVHRDFKNQNALVFHQGGRMVAKLGDFGEATNNLSFKHCGSTYFMSPEMHSMSQVTFSSDIWAWAMTLFRNYTGAHLFFIMETNEASLMNCFSHIGSYTDYKINQVLIKKKYMQEGQGLRLPNLETMRKYIQEKWWPKVNPQQTPGSPFRLPNRHIMEIVSSVIKLNPNARATSEELMAHPRYSAYPEIEAESPEAPKRRPNWTVLNSVSIEHEGRTFGTEYVIQRNPGGTCDFKKKKFYGSVQGDIEGGEKFVPRDIYFLNKLEKINPGKAEVVLLSDSLLASRMEGLCAFEIVGPVPLTIMLQRIPVSDRMPLPEQIKNINNNLRHITMLSLRHSWILPIRGFSINTVGGFVYLSYCVDLVSSTSVFAMGLSNKDEVFFARILKQMVRGALEMSSHPSHPAGIPEGEIGDDALWVSKPEGNHGRKKYLNFNLVSMYLRDLSNPNLEETIRKNSGNVTRLGTHFYNFFKKTLSGKIRDWFSTTLAPLNVSDISTRDYRTALGGLKPKSVEGQEGRHEDMPEMMGYNFLPDKVFTNSCQVVLNSIK